jgi:DNA polymerase beta
VFVESQIGKRFIAHSLTDINVDALYMGYCRYGSNPIRRVDIRFLPYESYSTALLYFTGSKNFNRSMRKYGNRLSEYQLTDPNGTRVPVNQKRMYMFRQL